jgi:hypothetical protein
MKAVNQSGDTEGTKLPALRIIRWKLLITVIFALFAVYGFYVTLFHAKWGTVALGECILFVKGQCPFQLKYNKRRNREVQTGLRLHTDLIHCSSSCLLVDLFGKNPSPKECLPSDAKYKFFYFVCSLDFFSCKVKLAGSEVKAFDAAVVAFFVKSHVQLMNENLYAI